ncbi:MAG: hypothetical protein OXC30_06520 [Alphaproteobacteria bacterium]|nr:hypothetical protein [Alphaproteobacteria bacterium]
MFNIFCIQRLLLLCALVLHGASNTDDETLSWQGVATPMIDRATVITKSKGALEEARQAIKEAGQAIKETKQELALVKQALALFQDHNAEEERRLSLNPFKWVIPFLRQFRD